MKTRNHSKTIVLVPLKDIKVFENPRIHPEREIEELIASIKYYGFTAPVFLSKRDNTLIAGYARMEAYKRLNREKIPSIHLDIEPKEYAAYAVIDNRIAELASWDYGILIKRIGEMEKAGDAMVIAYTPEEIEELRHWQEEAARAIDMEDLVEKKDERETEAGTEVVEILLTLSLSMWKNRRAEIDAVLADISLKFEGLKVTPPKMKALRKKK